MTQYWQFALDLPSHMAYWQFALDPTFHILFKICTWSTNKDIWHNTGNLIEILPPVCHNAGNLL